MNRQEGFLAKVFEAHRKCMAANAATREMLQRNLTSGPEWDHAIARQRAAQELWASLLRQYSEFQPEDGSDPV